MAQIKIRIAVLASAGLLLAACASQPQSAPGSQSPTFSSYSSPKQSLPGWIQQTEQQALADGVSANTVHAALDSFTPNPRVAELDHKQPETTITFTAYRRNTITAARVAKGAELMRRYADLLNALEARTGVPPQMVVALWGIESSYGQNRGGFETVNALATLAYQGRRADFFRGELIAALHILDQQHMAVSDLRGSWAGAMGQCQFMPSTYLKYAVDGDGDGRIDIWNDTSDALASIANYLAAEGWQRDQAWGREVTGAPDDPSQTGLSQTRTIQEWSQQGISALDGSPLGPQQTQASLLQPDGADGPAFLAYDNIRALMRWNHSTYFALSVGLLADDIKRNAP